MLVVVAMIHYSHLLMELLSLKERAETVSYTHLSFGHAIITRLLEAFGYKVGIIAQPDWKNKESITILGEPRLAFLVSAGNMDSMVNHYTVNKKRRHQEMCIRDRAVTDHKIINLITKNEVGFIGTELLSFDIDDIIDYYRINELVITLSLIHILYKS